MALAEEVLSPFWQKASKVANTVTHPPEGALAVLAFLAVLAALVPDPTSKAASHSDPRS